MGACCLVALAAGLLAGADSTQEEQKKLQGTWKVVSAEVEGVAIPREKFKGVTYRFDGDKMIEQVREHPEKRRYQLDPSAKPKTIDIRRLFILTRALPGGKVEKVEEREVTDLGIYRLKGDRLTICFRDMTYPKRTSAKRPTEFRTAPKSSLALMVLQRVK